MILNDKEIVRLCEEGMITPFVTSQARRNHYNQPIVSFGTSSYGYDVRCAGDFRVFTNTHNGVIDPKAFDGGLVSLEVHVSEEGDYVVLPPNSFALASTMETFHMPPDVIALCVGKSTYARCGIILHTTPLEPGWRGTLTLELSNTTPLPARVYVGEGIAQLLFFRGEPCATNYADRAGKYQDQSGLTTPKV